MGSPTPTLKDMLLEDLNPAFVRDLINNMPQVYADSFAAMMNDPNMGEDQAKVVLGHYRRGRAETLLQRKAVEHGIRQTTIQPAGGGCSHIRVQIGRFRLVMCHVVSRDAFPQHSDEREQSAKVNHCIDQLSLLAEEVTMSEGELYGVIIHTEEPGKKDKFSSIKIGFPDPEWSGWLEEPIDLLEISEIQSMRQQKKDDLQGQVQIDKAKPTWKKAEGRDKAQNDGTGQ